MTSLPLRWSNRSQVIASHRSWLETIAIARGVPRNIASTLAKVGSLLDQRFTRSSRCPSVDKVIGFEPADEGALLECKASDATVYALRDLRTTNWLYFGTPYLREKRLVFAARKRGRLVGYAAFKVQGTLLYLLECRCLGSDPEIAEKLLNFSIAYWYRHGGTHLTIWSYAPMIAAANRNSRPSSDVPMTYVHRANATDISSANWERTPGDGDIALF